MQGQRNSSLVDHTRIEERALVREMVRESPEEREEEEEGTRGELKGERTIHSVLMLSSRLS